MQFVLTEAKGNSIGLIPNAADSQVMCIQVDRMIDWGGSRDTSTRTVWLNKAQVQELANYLFEWLSTSERRSGIRGRRDYDVSL